MATLNINSYSSLRLYTGDDQHDNQRADSAWKQKHWPAARTTNRKIRHDGAAHRLCVENDAEVQNGAISRRLFNSREVARPSRQYIRNSLNMSAAV